MILDIIIPALNEEKKLSQLLPYLNAIVDRKQTNIIVVEASESDDNTKHICQENKVEYIKSNTTQRSTQMNEGAGILQGDYLMFLHADVFPAQNFYQKLENATKDRYEAGCFSYRFDSSSPMLKVNSYFTKSVNLFSGGGDQIQFISRCRFNQLGGFCERHEIMEDYEFYNRLRKAKIPYKVIDAPAKVSARKYKNNAWLKVNLVNLIALTHYKINQDPTKLKSLYSRWLD